MIAMTRNEIEMMLADARLGRLAMASGNGRPYIIPMPFCWVNNALYLRLAMTGRKGQVLGENDHVCFEVDEYSDDFSSYASVLVEGRLCAVTSLDEKTRIKALNDAKYLKLRNGYRPGHQRVTPLEDLPLVKIQVEEVCGRKKNSQNREIPFSHLSKKESNYSVEAAHAI